MSESDLKKDSETNWARVEAMTDEEIDTSDIAPLNEAFFAAAKLRLPKGKVPVIISVDADVVDDLQVNNLKRPPDGQVTLLSTAILEEYKTLRQEILNMQQFTHQISSLGFTVGGAVGAIVAVSESAPASVKAFTLLAIAVVFFSLISSQVNSRRSVNRIGRYIEYVIEPQVPGLYWESAYPRGSSGKLADEPSVIRNLPLLILQIISYFGAIYFLWQWKLHTWPVYAPIIVAGVIGVILLCCEWRLIRQSDEIKEFEDEFKKCAESIKQSVEALKIKS